jgi:hypothetical protein
MATGKSIKDVRYYICRDDIGASEAGPYATMEEAAEHMEQVEAKMRERYAKNHWTPVPDLYIEKRNVAKWATSHPRPLTQEVEHGKLVPVEIVEENEECPSRD